MNNTASKRERDAYVLMARLSAAAWIFSFLCMASHVGGIFTVWMTLTSTAFLIVFNIVVANDFRLWPFTRLSDNDSSSH